MTGKIAATTALNSLQRLSRATTSLPTNDRPIRARPPASTPAVLGALRDLTPSNNGVERPKLSVKAKPPGATPMTAPDKSRGLPQTLASDLLHAAGNTLPGLAGHLAHFAAAEVTPSPFSTAVNSGAMQTAQDQSEDAIKTASEQAESQNRLTLQAAKISESMTLTSMLATTMNKGADNIAKAGGGQ
ncbi:hypothetical protein G3O00_34875 [Burkholderia sp. Ac-20384]|uniref:hypothetical protein n=1 Tax=Burkholderia sp. Ac-20384 TaxID=2703902 RepID=UPI001981F865|nr:hypothetical protein [Burkholderia sp. Ac-20384]MBN3828750.1 hypothetical protein [Burkholderia sp. Ac-20384]